MKKIVLVALGLLALTACKQKSENAQDLALIQQRDSLNRIIAQKDGEINDMMSTMNDVVDGFHLREHIMHHLSNLEICLPMVFLLILIEAMNEFA